jgi:hypothetical protein
LWLLFFMPRILDNSPLKREWGCPFWDSPSNCHEACLSFAYGQFTPTPMR